MVIIEQTNEPHNKYIVSTFNGQQLASKRIVDIASFSSTHNGKMFTLIYGSDMIPNKDAFEYINYGLKSSAAKYSVDMAVKALKILLAYEEITVSDLSLYSQIELDNFISFLRGDNYSGEQIEYRNLTERSNQTVNAYLSIYRGFLKYLGKENKHLTTVSSKTARYSSYTFIQNKYTASLPTYDSNEVPMYISLDDYRSIIHVIKAKYTTRDEIIVRLMYEAGLRIGEVLGLTLEDITQQEIEGNQYFIIYIRNRYTDRKDQNAKTCIKITDRAQYRSKEYRDNNGRGYQTVTISEDLFRMIDDYEISVHLKARKKYKNRYMEKTKADAVVETDKDNHYLFLNSYGGSLTQSGWNKSLRSIFTDAGLTVDTNHREHNLNHRFRHGYAMYIIAHNPGILRQELMKAMRHSSIQSVEIYYRPTMRDEIAMKTSFMEDLYEYIPELKYEGAL